MEVLVDSELEVGPLLLATTILVCDESAQMDQRQLSATH